MVGYVLSLRDPKLDAAIRLVQPEVIAQIHAPDFGVVAQLVGPALPEDSAISEDIRAIGDAECFPHVMIRYQDANAGTA
jgi:hypothetical protein